MNKIKLELTKAELRFLTWVLNHYDCDSSLCGDYQHDCSRCPIQTLFDKLRGAENDR